MKNFAQFEQPVGDGKASGAVGVEGDQLKVQVAVTYPLEKVVDPAMKAINAALDKVEQLIPGDWDKALIEKLKVDAKADLVKFLSESPAQVQAPQA